MPNIDENIIERLKEIAASLGVKRLYLFGSALSKAFNEDSDIDILIAFDEHLSPEEYMQNYFELHYRLRDLFRRDVDIVTERSLSNPYFIQSIEATKKLIYEA